MPGLMGSTDTGRPLVSADSALLMNRVPPVNQSRMVEARKNGGYFFGCQFRYFHRARMAGMPSEGESFLFSYRAV